MSNDRQFQLSDHQDAQIARYQNLSTLAVAGLILGLLSPLAIVDPLLWGLPLLGIVLSGLGLWRIAKNAPALVGRKAALVGLTLSIFFGATALTNRLTYRQMLRGQARRFALQWFEFLAHHQPREAHQLTQHPRDRQPLDEMLEDFYRESQNWQDELKRFVDKPAVEKLLTLGENAQVRCHETAGEDYSRKSDRLFQVYAVYDKTSKTEVFYVGLTLKRLKPDTGGTDWQIVYVSEGIRSEDL